MKIWGEKERREGRRVWKGSKEEGGGVQRGMSPPCVKVNFSECSSSTSVFIRSTGVKADRSAKVKRI
jgi:hypothetical protein